MKTQEARSLSIADIQAGLKETLVWQVRADEIDDFARLSGDFNPLHMDADYARAQGFRDRVAHGYLQGAKISGMIGMRLPGKRCLLLEQAVAYPNPVYPGDEVTIELTVKELREEFGLIELKVRAVKIDNDKKTTTARGTVTCKILS